MADDPRAEIPLAPEAIPIPDANRGRLEALLRELLRDESIRQLFCNQEGIASYQQIESKPRRLRVSLRLVTSGAGGK